MSQRGGHFTWNLIHVKQRGRYFPMQNRLKI